MSAHQNPERERRALHSAGPSIGPIRQRPRSDPRSGFPGVQIGTSGWNYKHWAHGRFYPPGLSAKKWLAWYTGRFHTVEVNSSFYHIPSAQTLANWSKTAPSTFTFALKLWRGITHYRKLHDCREFIERFFAFAGDLPTAQRAPLLLQLPPHFTVNIGRLDDFFADLRSVLHGARWQVAVEFRHASWLTTQVYEYLKDHKASVALSDHGDCEVVEPNDVDFVYMRRHGQNASGAYTSRQIERDAELIRGWINGGKRVFVYYNNDWDGHAVDNARQLRDALDIEPPPQEGSTQQRTLFD